MADLLPPQFVLSRKGSPIVAQSVPKSNPSQHLDLNGSTNGSVPVPAIVETLGANVNGK
jgi:hypothetical protein